MTDKLVRGQTPRGELAPSGQVGWPASFLGAGAARARVSTLFIQSPSNSLNIGPMADSRHWEKEFLQ